MGETRRLVVMRHARSGERADSDHARTLTPRGADDAVAAGRRLAALGVVPDLIVASSAVRAERTAAGVVEGLGSRPDVRVLDEL